jgi:hypothetical protein
MGCGIVGVLVLICFIGAVVYIRSHPQAFTDFLMNRIESAYAPDVTDQDKADLRAAYAAYREKLKTKSVNSRSLDRVRVVLTRGGSSIGRDQVHELTAAFRDAAGQRDEGVPAVVITPPEPFGAGTPGPLASPTP